MNAEAIASLLFPNISTGGPTGDGTAQDAAESDTFLSLILTLLASARIPEVMGEAGSSLQLFDPELVDLAAFHPQDAEEKSGEVSVRDTELLGMLLSLGQNCSPSVFPRFSGGQQTHPPVTVESGRCKEISSYPGLTAEPCLAGFSTGLEEREGGPLNLGESVAAVQGDTGPLKPLQDLRAENPPSFPEIFEGTGEEQEPGKREQPLAGMSSTGAGTDGSRLEQVRAASDSGKNSLPVPRKDNHGKETENTNIQIMPGSDEPVVTENRKQPRVLKQENFRPSGIWEEPVDNGTLPTGPRDAPGVRTFSPPKPSDVRPEEATEVVKQIVEKAHLFVGKDVSSLRLQLKPEFLGNLKLTIKVEHGLVHARFTADNTVVAHLIETHLPELQNALADRGITWHQMSVSVDNQMNSGGFAHTQYEGRGSAQQHSYAYAGSSSGQESRGDASTVGYYYGNDGTVDYLI